MRPSADPYYKRHLQRCRDMRPTSQSNARSFLDSTRPKRWRHLRNKTKQRQAEDERRLQVERDNFMLVERMAAIKYGRSRRFEESAVTRPVVDIGLRRREEEKRIMAENLQLLARLVKKKPFYSNQRLLDERKVVEGYIRNIQHHKQHND